MSDKPKMSKDEKNALMQSQANRLELLVKELMPDTPFRWRKMFGGAGYYANDVMFAGWYGEGETIGLKLNENDCKVMLAIDGAEQGMGKHTILLPTHIWEDDEMLKEWLSKSINYVNRKKK
ncbi:MAG: TfoX/Sxy family protein [Chloroflexota bacterium]